MRTIIMRTMTIAERKILSRYLAMRLNLERLERAVATLMSIRLL